MKKRILSTLLALCMVSAILPGTVFAADENEPPLPKVTLDLPDGYTTQEEPAEYQLRQFTVETKEEPHENFVHTYDIYTYSGEPVAETLAVTPLPLGTGIRIDGMRPEAGGWFSLELKAWSDPDGDGVYKERIFFWQANFAYNCTDYSLIPLAEKDSFSEIDLIGANGYTTTADPEYCGFSKISIGEASLSATSDDLLECFGPNTLIQLTAWHAGYDENSTYYATEPETLACFLITGDGNVEPEPVPTFTDVPDWCATPVDWAVGREITNGTGDNKFSPQDLCKHAEILTFLWRAAGKPTSNAALPMDIAGKNVDWAADALRWATEKGMIDGSLDPNARCTRAEAVTYIWKALGGLAGGGASFPDVPDSAAYAKAVSWAVANGVTNGYEDGTFGPDKTCSRGEIVTFLYRAMG